jgi:S1-C subfamily serine protease
MIKHKENKHMSDSLKQYSDELAAILAGIDPSVVRIDARRRLPATGFVWDADGVIVTANHIVQTDDNIGIGLADGSTVAATLIGRDPYNDLAVLRAEGDFSPVARAAAEDIKIGHLVAAVGRPFNDLQATMGIVSAQSGEYGMSRPMGEGFGRGEGIGGRGEGLGGRGEGLGGRGEGVGGRGSKHGRSDGERGRGDGVGGRGSKRGRDGNRGRGDSNRGRGGERAQGLRSRRFGPWEGRLIHQRGWHGRMLAGGHIRTDVTMYPGFSGGPLVSAYGTVYGLNTSGFTRGASLTVPIGVIKKSVNALLVHGRVRQGYLGVRVQTANLPDEVAAELGNSTGVLVVAAELDSPAGKGGIMVGDIIVTIGDEPIVEADELPVALTDDLIGQEIALAVVRGGEMKELTVTIEEQA